MATSDSRGRSPGTFALDFGALLAIVCPEHEVPVRRAAPAGRPRTSLACAALIAVDAAICPALLVRRPTLNLRFGVEGNRGMEGTGCIMLREAEEWVAKEGAS